jgi:hypothetical protein
LWPPQSLIYLCGPPPFIGTVTYEKKLLYVHIVDLDISEYILITFTNNTVTGKVAFNKKETLFTSG